MLGHKFIPIATLIGAVLVAGQSLPVSLTSSCSDTLRGLLVDPEAECLNLSSLLTFVVNSNKSVPQTVNTWLTGLCAQGSCSDQTISNIVSNVTRGCSEDFTNANIDILSLQGKITDIAQRVYPTVRQVVCLEDTTTNQLCVTETLNNLESVVGGLGLDDLSFTDLHGDVQTLLASNVTELACTNCIKAAFSIAESDFPDQVSLADLPIEKVCGASFLDGNIPEEVVETAASGQFSPQNLATSNSASMKPMGRAAGWGLLFISAALVFTV